MKKKNIPVPHLIIDKPLNVEGGKYERFCWIVNGIVCRAAMNRGTCQAGSNKETLHVYQDVNLKLTFIDSAYYGDDKFLVEVNRRFLDDLDSVPENIRFAVNEPEDPYELVYEFADSFEMLLNYHRPGRWLRILFDLPD